MKINLLWPLRCLPWFTYVTILLFTQVVVIIPLSTVLWQEFYSHLVPPESRYSGSIAARRGRHSTEFYLNWVDRADSNEIITRDFSEERRFEGHKPTTKELSLPKNVPYYLSLSLQFYCFYRKGSPFVDVARIKVNDEVYYRDILCYSEKLRSDDRNPPSLKRYVNEVSISDVPIMPSTRLINVTITGVHLTGAESKFYLDMQLTGVRNLMLRWNKTCHIVGLVSFVTIVSCWFYFSFAIAFTVIGLIFKQSETVHNIPLRSKEKP